MPLTMKFRKETDGHSSLSDDPHVFAASSQDALGGLPERARRNCCRGLGDGARKKMLIFMTVGLVVVFISTGLAMIAFFRKANDGEHNYFASNTSKVNFSETVQTLQETTTAAPDTCSVEAPTNCSDPGDVTSEEKCNANECCWKLGNNLTPWCFFPSSPLNPKCDIHDQARVDCHPDSGSTAEKCRARGCCWFPANTTGTDIPYCFYKKDDVKCIVPDSNRVDCHPDSGSNTDTCIARGCCWVPANTTGKDIPHCFYQKDDTRCIVSDSNRANCHPESGSNPDTCLKRGCCWIPTSTGIPSCFYPANMKCKVPDTNRVDCHFENDPTRDKCRARSCCWVPSTAPTGIPHCFHPADMNCKVPDSNRVDCHPEAGSTAEKCRAKGCCWVSASPSGSGVPYCFHQAQGSSG